MTPRRSARRILLGTCAAAAALTAPAHAALIGPACATYLANAATGTSRYCETANPGDTGNTSGGFFRTVTLDVASGSATATLHCWTSYRSHTQSRTQAGPGVVTFGTWDDQTCRLTLTSNADGTVAAATSTTSYVISWE